MGWQLVTITGASSSSPFSRVTPRARPPAVWIVATGAFTRISAPKNRAESSHAFATAPMPPSMKPQAATSPSPMSPTEWCIIT